MSRVSRKKRSRISKKRSRVSKNNYLKYGSFKGEDPQQRMAKAEEHYEEKTAAMEKARERKRESHSKLDEADENVAKLNEKVAKLNDAIETLQSKIYFEKRMKADHLVKELEAAEKAWKKAAEEKTPAEDEFKKAAEAIGADLEYDISRQRYVVKRPGASVRMPSYFKTLYISASDLSR